MPFLLKKSLFFGVVLGVLVAIVWLLPVWNIPEMQLNRQDSTTWRTLRLVVPAVIALLFAACCGWLRRGAMLDLVLLVTFIFTPFFCWFFPETVVSKDIMVAIPLVLAAITIYAVSLWPNDGLRGFLIGVGLTVFIAILVRVLISGIEFGTYYGRPRMHLGFDHPLMTASAVILVAYSALAIIEWVPSGFWQTFLTVSIFLFSGWVLIWVDSKNMLLFFSIIFSLIFALFCVPRVVFLYMFAFAVPCSLLLATIFADLDFKYVSWLAPYESIRIRLIAWNEAFGGNLDPNLINIHLEKYKDTFAVFDSVYSTFLFRFGWLGLIFLCVWLSLIGVKQLYRWPKSLLDKVAFAGAFASSIFFFGDVQGLTPANLAVFMTLALSYRRAVS